ncbi:MAG: hypothetical protein QNI99_01960 [Woeseiaceae bacterium]|nr:hypothetical protein [Woeseiaceae bacterium]
MNIRIKITFFAALAVLLSMLATPANALKRSEDAVNGVFSEPEAPPLVIAQSNCMNLSQAVESVRRRGDVQQVVSAETQVRGGREVHVIKVLTRDGRVTTHRIPGCPVN